jgi:hypothetical protein
MVPGLGFRSSTGRAAATVGPVATVGAATLLMAYSCFSRENA